MGSRYGGLKQLDHLGTSGETIMDYSAYDAMRAGFGKVVFVIRRSFEKEFCEMFVDKMKGKIDIELSSKTLKIFRQDSAFRPTAQNHGAQATPF